MAEQGKKYRPLFEALMAKTDGLDILAEITGEKAPEEKRPEERKEAAAPADTFGGMLQSLPMLVMLPAIMPLLQQMLTQTLAASTVNVKVESATTILPIEISASTTIVPIEIKASSVTLNVNITGSNVTLNVNITGSDVTLNVTGTVSISGIVNVTGTVSISGIVNVTGTVSISGTVNVTGTVSISGTVNVTGTVSISGPVNVTGTVNIDTVSGTVNVNVQQAVELKIYTPSGRWVVASDLLPKLTERQTAALPAGTETTIRDLTGRGRLRTLSFLVYDAGTAFDIANDIRIRVYVDGSLRFEMSLTGVDSFSGYPVDYLRQALQYAVATGAALPFNTAKFAASPDRYIIMPPQASPLGGLVFAIWDVTNNRYRVMAGYINLAMEFTSSLSIRIYNRNSSYSAYAVVSYEVGEYP